MWDGVENQDEVVGLGIGGRGVPRKCERGD